MNIGDLLIRVLADMKDFQTDVVKEAEKAGDVAGKSMAQRIGTGLKAQAGKAVGVALAAGFAIATKGALELENATARYRAETGATADEAARASKVINRVAGEERMSLEAVTDVAIRVKRDLGATGEEADALTKKFARFARVTGQDAAGAVSAFDDILDAWGLSASEAGIIQDKLLVSQQKYGGSIQDNQKALANFAPQLIALNATYDDGIGLLNLFAASGLDASVATRALNSAVKNLKPGQSLDDLVKQISSIEDPTKRAQEAIKIFGARGGVSLANALKPGIDSLGDFAISADDAAGATDKAADIIDNTFSGRVQKAISVATASLREFGGSFGPALTGLAAMASLLAPLGGGKLAKGLLGGLVGFPGKFKTLVVKGIMSAIIPANAAGVLVGEATSTGVAEGMQGGKAAGLANKVLGPLGKVWGSILGKSFVLGALAVIGVELFQQLQDLNARNEDQVRGIGENIGEQISEGTVQGLQQSRAALEQAISDLNGPLMLTRSFNAGTINALQAQLDKVNAAILGSMTDIDKAASLAGRATGEHIVTSVAAGVEDHSADVSEAMRGSFVERMGPAFKKAAEEAKKYGGLTATAFANGILETQSVVKTAFAALVHQQETELTRSQEIAYDIGVLTSKELAQGLKDKRPGVRAQAEATKKAAIDSLNGLIKDGKPIGKKGMEALRQGMKSKDPDIRRAAKNVKNIIHNGLNPVVADAGGIGRRAAAAFKNAWNAFENFHIQLDGKIVGGFAEGGRPPVGVPSWVGERGRELFVPDVPGTIIPHGASESLASSAPMQFNITVNPGNDVSTQSARRFGQSVLDVVADGLREQTARTIR